MNADGTRGREIERLILEGKYEAAANLSSRKPDGTRAEVPADGADSASSNHGAPAQSENQNQTASDVQRLPECDPSRASAIPQLITGAHMAVKNYRRDHFLIGPKLLPVGGRMLITAETGTGKSALALHIAACIITGKPLFGLLRAKKDANFGKPFFPVVRSTDVLYLDFELPEQIRWQERLHPLRTNSASTS